MTSQDVERLVWKTLACPKCGHTTIARMVRCFAVFDHGEFAGYLHDGDWQYIPGDAPCFCTKCEYEWLEEVP